MNEPTLPRPSQLEILLGALRELGPRQVGYYALYKIGLQSGFLGWKTRRLAADTALPGAGQPARLFPPPDREGLAKFLGEEGRERLLAETGEVLDGRVRLFGGRPIPLQLHPPEPRLHWTAYERRAPPKPGADVKLTWEPARLGWGILLARAYRLTGDERYPATFWKFLEEFLDANPPYLGLNWVSAQEAALRLISLVFCWQVFADSVHSTSARAGRLARAIAIHAGRIPPSLVYARAQNNNHLLSEAAGLYTAGLALPDHPRAERWLATGWRLFHQGIRDQVEADGAYCQHSTNYHRLMLQLALWVHRLAEFNGQSFPAGSAGRLAAASRWLGDLLDPRSGKVPNLGPNDGAYILPLASLDQGDYRPVVQAAGAVFRDRLILDAGPWDEMGAWLGAVGRPVAPPPERSKETGDHTPLTLHSAEGDSWAYLRAAHFRGRPGHADQLHVDLWWRGLNVALDPGTYLYNAPLPWENGLAGSDVHNTLTVDGLDQMQRVGRFLYLHRAQASAACLALETGRQPVVAEHDGYRRIGALHRRRLASLPGEGWQVEDELLPFPSGAHPGGRHRGCLHWLVPDWPWEAQQDGVSFLVRLASPQGPVELELAAWGETGGPGPALQIARAGELVYGSGQVKPTWGWFSPTYNDKIAALSVRLYLEGELPLYFKSKWKLG